MKARDEQLDVDLGAEVSLLRCYLLARSVPHKWSSRAFVLVMLLLPVTVVSVSGYSANHIIELVKNIAGIWLGVAATVLGFLIAAYAIVISVLKPDLLLAMARIKKSFKKKRTVVAQHNLRKKDISVLKYNLLAFIGSLIDYFVFILLCWSILSVSPDDAVDRLVGFYPYPEQMRYILAVSLFEIVAGGVFILIWDLKVYIFNLYRLTLDSVRWELRHEQVECRCLHRCRTAENQGADQGEAPARMRSGV